MGADKPTPSLLLALTIVEGYQKYTSTMVSLFIGKESDDVEDLECFAYTGTAARSGIDGPRG